MVQMIFRISMWFQNGEPAVRFSGTCNSLARAIDLLSPWGPSLESAIVTFPEHIPKLDVPQNFFDNLLLRVGLFQPKIAPGTQQNFPSKNYSRGAFTAKATKAEQKVPSKTKVPDGLEACCCSTKWATAVV